MTFLNAMIAEPLTKDKSFGDLVTEALELITDPFENPISSPKHAERCFRLIWNKALMSAQEQFYVLLLDSAMRVINWKCLFTGSTLSCPVDIKILMRHALKAGADGIIVAHNHPNDTLDPSQADLDCTEMIQDACETVGLVLQDAQILTSNAFFSFVTHGLINHKR